jgi:anti-sigma factor RsiW
MTDRAAPHGDLASYVLGALTPDQVSAFEAHLRGCQSCSAEVAELGSLPALLASASPSPPVTLRQRTFDAIAAAAAGAPVAHGPANSDHSAPAEPPPAPAASPVPLAPSAPRPTTPSAPADGPPSVVTPMPARWSRRSRQAGPARPASRPGVGRFIAAAAAALLVVAAVGIGTVLLRRDPGPSTTVALVAVGSAPGQGEAAVRPVTGGREVRLEVSGLPANPPGTFYECWLVSPSDTARKPNRVSVGTFTVGQDGTASVVWVSAADPARFPKMGVTLEPDDGNPTANGPKVLAGT